MKVQTKLRLIFSFALQDHVLIQLETTGLKARGKAEGDLVKEDDPILVVHPNYVIDS